MRQEFVKYNGITLISLVITIVILIVLAGISIVALTEENGLISKVNEARKKSEESSAREKLELVLMNANTEKESNNSYNSQEYLTNMLENEGMTVNGDTILVDKYNFLIDREKLIILDGLGETTVTVAQEVKEYLGKNADDKYEANIIIKISSNVGISKISIEGDSGNIIEMDALGTVNEIGKDMTVELDKEYKIIVTSFDGKETVSKIIEKSEEKISTVDNLMAFRDEVNKGLTYEGKTITLTEDINLSSICGKDIGNWVPIGNETNKFKGTFDGNYKTINNLYISSTEDYQALFGNALNATIKNLILENTDVTGKEYIAGLLGYGENITIENCGLQGNINATLNDCGGIAGKVINGTISKCYNKSDIKLNATVNYDWAGGIIGYAENVNVSYCYNTGILIVNGKNYNDGSAQFGTRAGGIVGNARNNSVLEYSYNTGNITSYGYGVEPAGISGVIDSSNINSCFNIGSINGIKGSSTGGFNRAGNITAWTKNSTVNNCYYIANNMCGFDYTGNSFSNNKLETADNIKNISISILGGDNNIWVKLESENDGYPILKWQNESE